MSAGIGAWRRQSASFQPPRPYANDNYKSSRAGNWVGPAPRPANDNWKSAVDAARYIGRLNPYFRLGDMIGQILVRVWSWYQTRGGVDTGLHGWIEQCTSAPQYDPSKCDCVNWSFCNGPNYLPGNWVCGTLGSGTGSQPYDGNWTSFATTYNSDGCTQCGQPNFCNTRYRITGVYTRPPGNTEYLPAPYTPVPRFFRQPIVISMPDPWTAFPWADPERLPIKNFAYQPHPPTWEEAGAMPDRLPWREAGYTPPAGRIDVPVVIPDPNTAVDVGTGEAVTPVGRKPPPKGEKERKYRATAATRAMEPFFRYAAKAYEKTADLRDIVQALNRSLPKELRSKSKSLPDLIRNVIEHIDEVPPSAVLEVIKELAEDRLGGFGDMLKSEIAKRNRWFKTKLFTSGRF